ncbi:MAG: LysM domain-containing protein [Acidobacteriota bacterium]
MILKGSRYERVRAFTGEAAFPGLRPRPVETALGAVEHTVQAGDRLDLLARHYYSDDRLWWRILDANPRLLFAGDVRAGDIQAGDAQGDSDGRLEGMAGQVILIPKARD